MCCWLEKESLTTTRTTVVFEAAAAAAAVAKAAKQQQKQKQQQQQEGVSIVLTFRDICLLLCSCTVISSVKYSLIIRGET